MQRGFHHGLLVLLVRAVIHSGPPAARPGEESAEDILRRRYAAGEITREQFEQMRRDLE